MAESDFTGYPWLDDPGIAVTPPRRRPSGVRLLGSALVALVVISSLIGALLLAMPAMEPSDPAVPEVPEAAENR
ncbi:hypothetical protein RM844_23580 [Streptomyces sp. DSM 44915]|uniref:Uncharacterized protein n=1 Tax=Streptomyces chisholmiae TaxID=3075540 RepID=A0ABU2JX00_9ACTN|nr:hypothetical protein [Streptomyces sp. DSM 44915]MDT0269271.1 hypothetical protein [Streptomyces sp. DSM 44915]